MFMLPTAAFIATASRCAPITPRTISSEAGEIAAARQLITFSSARYSLEKCEWDRTSRTSARAHPHSRRVLLQQQPLVLLHRQVHLPLLPCRALRHRHKRRPRHKERRSPARPPKRRRRRVRRLQMQVRLRQQFQQALLPPHRLVHKGSRRKFGHVPEPNRRAVADPDRGLAATVFCRLASCASLCAAQHQSRFEHAIVPVPLRETAHHWRAFRGCIATFRCRCATRRLGGCSDVRCKMSGCLFDGAKSIPSVERSQISRSSCPIICDSNSGRFTRSPDSCRGCIACRGQKITQ